ncbi:hypothetical protein [Belnapia moabensis]|uniref:hypothetical protein n=1 Tax=Belnapia moabensis TaxID=365533 RepID=UPI0012EDFDFF|nr:hypothetical protein [Belnapia moabensis]
MIARRDFPHPSWRLSKDFIERLFGFSPDGGSGAFEILPFAIPIAGIAYLAMRRWRRRKP